MGMTKHLMPQENDPTTRSLLHRGFENNETKIMAEALAIIGLASAIVQFIDFGSKIVHRLQDFQSSVNEVPKTFQDIKVELPLLLDTLKRTQVQAESGAYSRETQEALRPVVEGCRSQVELLDKIIVKILPKPEDSSLRRGMLAFSSVGQEKKVERIASTLRQYVQILTYNQSIGAIKFAIPPGPVSYEVRPLRLVGSPIVSDFIERPQVIEAIRKEMLPISTERQTLVACYGVAGTGKSQAAKRYAELHQPDYSAIFWINATTERSTQLGIAKLAELIPLPNTLNSRKEISRDEDGIAEAQRAVNEWLCSEGNTKWLLIFDDVPWTKEGNNSRGGSSENNSIMEEAFDAYEYVPRVSHGSILVTSRVSSVVYAFGAGSVHVDAMLEDEGVQLLRKACRRSREEVEMRTLAARLGMHPLALSQAGRYLLETRSSVSSYLEKYDSRFKILLKRQPLVREYQNGSVDATLSLSFDSLAARDPSAAALLMLWSCFDKSNISFELFRYLSQLGASGHPLSLSPDPLKPLNPRARIDALPPTWLDQICADEDEWLARISALQDFSFIRQNDMEESISLHPLIHEWSIRCCESSWTTDNMAATANLLGAISQATKGKRVGGVYYSLQSHVDHWYSMLPLAPSQPLSQCGVDTAAVFEIAHFYRRRGFIDRYRVLSDDLLSTFTARLGPTHRKTLELRLDILSILLEESKWEEAIQGILLLREQILQICWMPSLTLKENNAFILSSLAWHLSIACGQVGKIKPLEELLGESEKLQDDPDILRLRPSLVFACLWLKHIIATLQEKDCEVAVYDPYPLMEAEIQYLKILDDTTLWPTPPGRQHLLTQSHLLRLLGEQYFDQRDLAKAKACLVKSFEIFKGIDGSQSLTTLGLAGAIVSHGWTPNSPPVLGIPGWHRSIISVLRMIVKEMKEVPGNPQQSVDGHSSQKHEAASLGHLHWSKAISSVRTIVREQPTEN